MKMTLTMDDGNVKEFEGKAFVFGMDEENGASTGVVGNIKDTTALACMVAKNMADSLGEQSEIMREAYVMTLFQMLDGKFEFMDGDELKATNEEA